MIEADDLFGPDGYCFWCHGDSCSFEHPCNSRGFWRRLGRYLKPRKKEERRIIVPEK